MKSKIISTVLLAACFLSASLVASPNSDYEQRVELAKEIMHDLPIWKQLEQSVGGAAQELATVLSAGNENLLGAYGEDFMMAMKKVHDSEAFLVRYAELYAKHFTLNELEAMARFYASPEGRSISTKLNPLMRDAMSQVPDTMISVFDELETIIASDERIGDKPDLSVFRQQFEAMKQMF